MAGRYGFSACRCSGIGPREFTARMACLHLPFTHHNIGEGAADQGVLLVRQEDQ
jgi:hypothetical protein